MFQGGRARLGWNAEESQLTPALVASPAFGSLWSSAPFEPAQIGGHSYAAHAFASPLFADAMPISSGPYRGLTFDVVLAATTSGVVYALSTCPVTTQERYLEPGTVLWHTQLGTPGLVAALDGGIPLGVLGTPVLDTRSARLYVASMDASRGWQVYALDAGSGEIVPGWPVTLDDASLSPLDENGSARFGDATVQSQRGALALSADGGLLYVPFGAYMDGGTGWMVVVRTTSPGVAAAFSSAPTSATSNGGIWSAGGAAIDDAGHVFVTTGNSPSGSLTAQGVWGESLLEWTPDLRLIATYTPWNYCRLDDADIDLGGSSPMILPDLDPATTSTPHLAALGGKQGNVYLVDRDHLPGGLSARPPCETDSSLDGSLLPPELQPALGARGPLNVFGPYSEEFGNLDYGRMRSTPAYFVDAAGGSYVYVSGTSKAAPDSSLSVAPSLVRLRVVTSPGKPAYLAVDAKANGVALENPGSPLVTSNGALTPIVWVLDENGARTTALVGSDAPRPILWAFDGTTLAPLWHSPTGLLHVGGKYATPVVEHGVVLVATDRIQAFGVAP